MNNTQLENGNRLAKEITSFQKEIELTDSSFYVEIKFFDRGGNLRTQTKMNYEDSKPIIKKRLDWLKYKLENAKLQFSKL